MSLLQSKITINLKKSSIWFQNAFIHCLLDLFAWVNWFSPKICTEKREENKEYEQFSKKKNPIWVQNLTTPHGGREGKRCLTKMRKKSGHGVLFYGSKPVKPAP